MTLTVWSEQGEQLWRDCMHAAYLMLMVFGGVLPAKFQLGINTSAERERFENAEGLPESQQEQGLVGYGYTDIAAKALYGVTAHDATEDQLPGLLATVGVAIALTGNGVGLPPTPLYLSGFQGNHSVTVVPLGNGMVTLLDPLQRSGTTFSPFPVSTILAWHRRLTYGQDIRYVHENEFVVRPPVVTPTTPEVQMILFIGLLGSIDVTTAPNVRGVNLETGALVEGVAGKTYPVFGHITLATPIAPTPDSAECYVVTVAGAPVGILARNCLYTPAVAPAVSHTVVLTVDGKTVSATTL